MSPRQPIKLSDLDNSRMKRGGLLNKHFCKNKIQISPMTQEKLSISNFSYYKSVETISCHSNQSSYPTGIKKHNFSFPLPVDAMCNMERIRLTASEEMSFENIDGWTDAGCLYVLYYKLTCSLGLR